MKRVFMLQKSLQSSNPQCEGKESRRGLEIERDRKWSGPVGQFQNLAGRWIEVNPGHAKDYD